MSHTIRWSTANDDLIRSTYAAKDTSVPIDRFLDDTEHSLGELNDTAAAQLLEAMQQWPERPTHRWWERPLEEGVET